MLLGKILGTGHVGEAIPVRTEEGPAGNGAPPRSGPLTPTPSSRGSSQSHRDPRIVGDVGLSVVSRDSSNEGYVTPTSQTPLKMTKAGEGGMC